jgi:hypothetical protein
MQTKKTSLIDIANLKPQKEPKKKKPTPKALREVEIRQIGDWLLWIEIAKERSNKELVTEKVEAEMLEIIQQQFSELSKIQKALARLMTNYSELIANERYVHHALSEIFKNTTQLEKVEKLTNKGGRKRNKELYEIAHTECIAWFSKKGKMPSASKLVSLVEFTLTSKKGEGREDGNKYISVKSASNFLKQLKEPVGEFNRQELVTSFAI